MQTDGEAFRYLSDVLSAEEEALLLEDLSRLDVQPLRIRGLLTERDVASFGLDYWVGQ